MSQEHTIVVRFADGVVPRYSAVTEFQGGQVVAVDFDGNRLRIAQELEEALNLALEYWQDRQQRYKNRSPVWVQVARAALAKARGES